MAEKKLTIALQSFFAITSACLVLLLMKLYFQQDEWHSFGLILGYGKQYLFLDKPVWQVILADRIGARSIVYGLFTTYGANALPFGLLAVFLHTVNSYLVVRLTYQIIKHRTIAWISGIFFLVNSVSHQAYSWFGTMAGTTPAVTCILFSALFFISFLEHRKKTDYAISFFFLWLSFLFKETGFFLLLAYPAIWFVYTKNITRSRFFRDNIVWLVYGCAMASLLLYIVLSIPGDRANYISPESSGYWSLVKRSMVYPFEGSTNTFLPAEIVYTTARTATLIIRPDLEPETSEFDIFYQIKMVEYITIFLGCLFIAGLYRVWIKRSLIDPSVRRILICGTMLLFFSFAPYIVLGRFDAYLDSRYYYTPLIGSSLLFGAGICVLMQRYRRFGLITASTILLLHTWYLGIQLTEQYSRSVERQTVIQQILSVKPELGDRTVFFVTGNTPGYYGIEELKVPFQSGLGQILMVMYGQQGQLPPGFFQEETLVKSFGVGFLYDTLGQGYREIDGRGFGYFYDENEMNKQIASGAFSEEDVVRLFYNSDIRKIISFDFAHTGDTEQ